MKGLLFALSVVTLITVTSCAKKKDWTCVCNYGGLGGTGDTTEYLDITKSDVKKLCQESIVFGVSTGCVLNEKE